MRTPNEHEHAIALAIFREITSAAAGDDVYVSTMLGGVYVLNLSVIRSKVVSLFESAPERMVERAEASAATLYVEDHWIVLRVVEGQDREETSHVIQPEP